MNRNTLELENLIQGFILSCHIEGKSLRTIEWYHNFLNRFLSFLKAKGYPSAADKIDKNHVSAFILHLQQEARKAGLDEFHTHTMRHKFATDLLERGANIKQVQELLGHENLPIPSFEREQGKFFAYRFLLPDSEGNRWRRIAHLSKLRGSPLLAQLRLP